MKSVGFQVPPGEWMANERPRLLIRDVVVSLPLGLSLSKARGPVSATGIQGIKRGMKTFVCRI